MTINTNAWNRIRYTLWAPIYDRIAAFPTYRRRSIELLGPAPGDEVLIIGAGTGADLPYLPPTVNITAVDLTAAMLERLKQRAQALGRPVSARVGDGQALDLPAARFDAVILHLILAVIPDPVACIREAERVLKPGGRIVIFDKFVPDDEEPSFGRRITNVVTNLLFSDITRKLGPLIAQTNLVVERDESARVAGVPYRTVVLIKKG
jgi:phosphatidylethanolamine/phosphatidyl-N-methylethanolamine N-methyltransferase